MYDPDAAAVSVNVVSAQMAQYGQWYRTSDLWSETNLPGTREALIDRMAYRGALTVDTLIRDTVLSAGGSAQIGGTAIARTSMNRNGSFDLDVAEVRQAVRGLRASNVPTNANGLYTAITHPHAEFIIKLLQIEIFVSKFRKLREILSLKIKTIRSQAQKFWEGSETIIGEPKLVM